MKKLIFFVIIFPLTILFANAIMIRVGIKERLDGEISFFNIKEIFNLVKFEIEFYNTGSLEYKARVRVDILNNSKIVFTAWSNEVYFSPGDRRNFNLYWFSNTSGNFTIRVRVYYGNEIEEKIFNFKKNSFNQSLKNIEISPVRVYDNFIVFDLKTEKNISKVIIIPDHFPTTWIVEQKEIEIKGRKTVSIDYLPVTLKEREGKIIVVSSDGKYFGERNFIFKKEIGLKYYILLLIDKIKLAFY